jgi:hypothetical protein
MKLILIAMASLGLAACQPVPGATPTPNPTPNEVSDCGIASNTVIDEKVMIGAESAYNIAAHTYLTLDGAEKLDAEAKAKVRPMLVSAYDNLKLARTAYNAGDGCSLKNYTDLVEVFTSRARSLFPAS